MRRVLALGPAFAVLATLIGPTMSRPATADTNPCPNRSGAYGNIVVGAGQTCTLNGATVTGNILVLPGGTLDVEHSTVSGNISATQSVRFPLDSTTVGGNVTVQNAPGFATLSRNQIRGSVSLTGNTGSVGVFGNTITGILSCQGNNPPPTSDSNTAARFVGQCSD